MYVLWGNRVIIPPAGKQTLLNELHQTHPGIVKMKSLARSVIWWSGMDSEIEYCVQSCYTCQSMKTPLHPWIFTDRPWSRLHIDYCGPLSGTMLLVIIDSHSKWLEIHIASRTFSTHGIPDTIVSDNTSCFTSNEFIHFCKMNGIKHNYIITSAPYHPSTNGMAERDV